MFSALDTLFRVQEAFERARDMDLFGPLTSRRGVFPPINFFEKDDKLMAVAELPGMNKDDIQIEVRKNEFRLSGKREIDYGDDVSIHRWERRPRAFDRTLRLPFEVDHDAVRANYENGILTVTLPRHPSEASRKIAIN